MDKHLGLCKFGAVVMSSLERLLTVQGVENLPRESAVYVVKHQSIRDIWGMGVILHRHREAYVNYVRRNTLPAWMDLLGGTEIYRPQDVQKRMDAEPDLTKKFAIQKSLRRANLENMKMLREQLTDTHPNNSVIICPEGHRYKNIVGPLNTSGLSILISNGKRDVPIVPVGTEYRGLRAYFRIGKPLFYPTIGDAEANEVRYELAKLSHCSMLDITSQTEQVRVS